MKIGSDEIWSVADSDVFLRDGQNVHRLAAAAAAALFCNFCLLDIFRYISTAVLELVPLVSLSDVVVQVR